VSSDMSSLELRWDVNVSKIIHTPKKVISLKLSEREKREEGFTQFQSFDLSFYFLSLQRSQLFVLPYFPFRPHRQTREPSQRS